MRMHHPAVLSFLQINVGSRDFLHHSNFHHSQRSLICRSEPAPRYSRRFSSPPSRRPPPSSRPPPPPPAPREERSADEGSSYEGPTDAEVWIERLRRLPPTARSVALQQLLRIEEEGAYSGLVGGSPNPTADTDADSGGTTVTPTTGSGRNALDERSRRQATDLVSSVTRWKRRLAWTLSHLPKPTNLDKMDAPLRLLLLMGTYEILDLELAPYAVNEYVNLAKSVMHEGCGKVTNGVLRTLLRCIESKTLPKPPPPGPDATEREIADAMGVATSHPTWLVKKWLGSFGRKDTMDLLKQDNMRPRYSLRLAPGIDPAVLSEQLSETGDASVRPSQFLPDEFLVVESGLQSVLSSGILKKGQGQVQDEAAGLVVTMLGPQPGDSVLDCCAAPGGKTLFAAARMKQQGRLVALDSSASRLRAVAATARSQGIIASDESNNERFLKCVAQDARQYCGNSAAADDYFDRVLVDAPCSGTGVLAKRADLRWRRQPEDVEVLCGLQRELLEAASEVVRPGGLLVYSTCSLEKEENEDIVQEFLSSEAGKEFIVEAPPVGDVPAQCLSDDGMLRMLPHVHGTDGAFAARLRKSSDSI